MTFNLRTYRTSDLPELFLVDTMCFEPPFRFSREMVRRFAEAGNAIVRVAVQGGADGGAERVAGFCIVHLEQSGGHTAGYIVTLDVHPGFRRQGLGPALMSSVENAARDAGAHAMVLHVWARNDAAIRLYERLGYRYTRTARGFYRADLDALVYRKPLTAREQISSAGEPGASSTVDGSPEPAS